MRPLEKSAESNRLRLVLLDEFGDEIVSTAAGDGGGVPEWRAAAGARQRRQRHVRGGHRHRDARSRRRALRRFPRSASPTTSRWSPASATTSDSTTSSFARSSPSGAPHDVVLAVSTSGNSENLVRGLGEARRRGMSTIAICGYDGGRLAREAIADHCFVVRSSSVHRIQEVQMTLYHLLTELVHRALEGEPACA